MSFVFQIKIQEYKNQSMIELKLKLRKWCGRKYRDIIVKMGLIWLIWVFLINHYKNHQL